MLYMPRFYDRMDDLVEFLMIVYGILFLFSGFLILEFVNYARGRREK